jgi:hypothetical protein
VSRAAALALGLVALAGCGGGGSPSQKPPSGEAVIRGWTDAMYKGDYDRAGRFFARDALVQQNVTIVLRTHEDAVGFGRSLPCRAKVTSVRPERNGVLLASFDLFPGIHGTCPQGGTARVRFFIRHGLIETWRQLPDAPQPDAQTI